MEGEDRKLLVPAKELLVEVVRLGHEALSILLRRQLGGTAVCEHDDVCRLASAEHDASGAVIGSGCQPSPVDLPHDLRQSGDCCISRQGVRHRPETEEHLREVAVAMLPGRKLDMAVSALVAGIELRRLCKLITCLVRETINGVTSLLHVLVLVFVAAPITKELIELGD